MTAASGHGDTDMMEHGQHIAEQAFRAFVDHSPLSIAMLDHEQKVLTTSPGWRLQQQSESPTEAALSQDEALAKLIQKALNGEPGKHPQMLLAQHKRRNPLVSLVGAPLV